MASTYENELAFRMSNLGIAPTPVGSSKFAVCASEEDEEQLVRSEMPTAHAWESAEAEEHGVATPSQDQGEAGTRLRDAAGNPASQSAWMSKMHSLQDIVAEPLAMAALERFAMGLHASENVLALKAIDLLAAQDVPELDALLLRQSPHTQRQDTTSFDSLADARYSRFSDDDLVDMNMARRIFDTFFRPDAPCWICIEATKLASLQSALMRNHPLQGDEFAAARREIFASINSSVFPQFVKHVLAAPDEYVRSSPSLKQLKKRVGQQGAQLLRDSLSSVDQSLDRQQVSSAPLQPRTSLMRKIFFPSAANAARESDDKQQLPMRDAVRSLFRKSLRRQSKKQPDNEAFATYDKDTDSDTEGSRVDRAQRAAE